jgi:hypothetical protein
MSSNGLCVEGLVPQPIVLLGGDGAMRRWGLAGGGEVIGGVALKGIVGTQCLLSLFASGHHDVNGLPLFVPASSMT